MTVAQLTEKYDLGEIVLVDKTSEEAVGRVVAHSPILDAIGTLEVHSWGAVSASQEARIKIVCDFSGTTIPGGSTTPSDDSPSTPSGDGTTPSGDGTTPATPTPETT